MYNINYINNIYKLLQNNNINSINSIYNIIHYILNDITNYYDNENNHNINKKNQNQNQNQKINNNNELIENFNIKINEIENMLNNNNKEIIKIYDIINNKLNNNIINDIFMYHFKNDNLIYIKDYYKYYNNPLFTEYVVNIGNPSKNDYIFDGNLKINSFLNYVIKKLNITDLSKLYGCNYNKYIIKLCILELYLNNNLNISNNIFYNDILIDDINQNYDLIYIDLPTNYHNIIYANCCNKIKQLKIRGTKSEPLLLQLVMLSLNKNGRAVIIVNDSLLFNDSNQHIKTRQFLIENFNLKKIIQIDEKFYNIKGIKNSILYFENNYKTKNIDFVKLIYDNDNNKIIEEFIINIDYELIINNNWSLYYKLYNELKNINNNNNLKYINIKEVFKIINNKEELINNIDTSNTDYNIIIIPKYYKSHNIKIIKYNEINNYLDIMLYLIEKKNDDYKANYLNIYVINILKNKINLFIKGKMNQINIDKIYNIEIPILTLNIQETICNYYLYSDKLYQDNKKQIEIYINMKKCLFNSLINSNYIELNEIIELKISNEINKYISYPFIGIIRNGLTTGTVNLINNNILSNNSYYLLLKNNVSYLIEFIYYYLQYNEDKLKELSNLTQQNSLNKSNLLLFKIPILLLEHQKYIVSYCTDFDNIINKHIENNNDIKNKDIMLIINKIYNIN